MNFNTKRDISYDSMTIFSLEVFPCIFLKRTLNLLLYSFIHPNLQVFNVSGC